MAYRPPHCKRQSLTPGNELRSKSPPQVLSDEKFPALCESAPRIESREGPAFAECLRELSYFSGAKDDEVISSEEIDNAVPPGWVSAKLTELSRRKVRYISKEAKIHSPRNVEKTLGKMVARWQGQREQENELLGDRSYYWNQAPLGEDSEEDLS